MNEVLEAKCRAEEERDELKSKLDEMTAQMKKGRRAPKPRSCVSNRPPELCTWRAPGEVVMKMMRESIRDSAGAAEVASQAGALATMLQERNQMLEAELKSTRAELAQVDAAD